MNNKPLILVVEDDAAVRNLMSVTLDTQGYRYHLARNGSEALIETSTHQPDVMLLDLGLPDMEGVDIIRKVRGWTSMPIIVISARSEDADKVEALDAGADDYLTKPFSVDELLARLRVALRRLNAEGQNSRESAVYENGGLRIDYAAGCAYMNGSEIHLTPPVESRAYIKMTLLTLRDFGIRIVSVGDEKFHIPGNQKYRPHRTRVEGDWSNGAFLEALNVLGGKVRILGLNRLSPQGDKICLDHFKALQRGKPTLNLSDCPDLAPVLMALSAACHGAVFTGTGRLRLKESDRGRAMAAELEKFGAQVLVEDERIWVGESPLHRPSESLDAHNDHRIAMALAVLCTLFGGTIRGAEAVAKSWPDFFRVLEKLGVELREEPEEETT